jgi:hypothetical protein
MEDRKLQCVEAKENVHATKVALQSLFNQQALVPKLLVCGHWPFIQLYDICPQVTKKVIFPIYKGKHILQKLICSC